METTAERVGIGLYPIKTITHSTRILTSGTIDVAGEAILHELNSRRGNVPNREGGNFQIEVLDLDEDHEVCDLADLSSINPAPLLGSDFHLLSVLAHISENRGHGVLRALFDDPRPILVRHFDEDKFLVAGGASGDGTRGKIHFRTIDKRSNVVRGCYRPVMICAHR